MVSVQGPLGRWKEALSSPFPAMKGHDIPRVLFSHSVSLSLSLCLSLSLEASEEERVHETPHKQIVNSLIIKTTVVTLEC